MKLQEAFDKVMFSLNAGGVPVVLVRLSSGLKDAVRVYEVRIRWTGCNDSWRSSVRTPLIVEKRRRTAEGWLEWGIDDTPFSVDDMAWPYWEVRYPGHEVLVCPACKQEEQRTDPAMIEIYGPVTSKHRCGAQALEE